MWIAQHDGYDDVIREGKCGYTELHACFNATQLFLNVQEDSHPLRLGYDFEFGEGGGWLPLFDIDERKGGINRRRQVEYDDNAEKEEEEEGDNLLEEALSGLGTAGILMEEGISGLEDNFGDLFSFVGMSPEEKAERDRVDLTRPKKGVLLPKACRLVSLGPPTSADHVAENSTHVVDELVAAISNYRQSRNMESRWDGNEQLGPLLQRAIKAKIALARTAPVARNGWNPRKREWIKQFPRNVTPFSPQDRLGITPPSTVNVQKLTTDEKGDAGYETIRYTTGWYRNRGEFPADKKPNFMLTGPSHTVTQL